MSEYEFEQLRQEAEKHGCSMSDLVRKYVSRLPEPIQKPSF